MPINPKKYSCYGVKKIHTRNLVTKKNSCGSKIPLRFSKDKDYRIASSSVSMDKFTFSKIDSPASVIQTDTHSILK